MYAYENLHTIAEIAAAFVGFSTVVAVLGSKTDAFRFYSIRDVATTSLTVLAGALIPLTLRDLVPEEEDLWRISCGAFFVAWVISAYIGIRSYNQNVTPNETLKVLIIGPIATFVGNIVLLWNTVSPTEHIATLYTLCLLALLAFAAVSFIVATFGGVEIETEGDA